MKKQSKNNKGFTRLVDFGDVISSRTKGASPKLTTGFTLIEILIGVAIFVMIVLALTLFSKNVWVYNSFIGTKFNDTNSGRQTLKNITAEIRTASAASTGAYAVSAATATSFTFYSDIYDDGLKEKIRYFLNGTTLQKGVTKPTGSPLTYNAANEVLTTLMTNITSSSIFYYYDKNYDGTNAALSSPVDVSVIRLIKINVTTDSKPSGISSPSTFTTQVSLRNLKDNL